MFRIIARAALALSLTAVGHAQSLEFWTAAGSSSSVDAALDGASISDHLVTSDYSGFVGEVGLMPTTPGALSSVAPGTPGTFEGDSGGLFSGTRGLVGFDIDSETPFHASASLGETHIYQALDFASANAIFQADGVSHYIAGRLLRAAYLLENYYATASSGNHLDAAAMQAAIWEVLYDLVPNVGTGEGNYYVRNNVGSSIQQDEANAVIATANAWIAEAELNNWGGPGYDPGNRVIFWLDPNHTANKGSVITLNPSGSSLILVPEPSTALLALFGLGAAVLRRRR